MFSNAFEHDISLPTSTQIGGGLAVRINNGLLEVAGAAAADWVGVTMYHSGRAVDGDVTSLEATPGATNEVVSVRARSSGILVEMLAGGTIAMGALVEIGTGGKAVAGTTTPIGIARTAAANNQYVTVLLT